MTEPGADPYKRFKSSFVDVAHKQDLLTSLGKIILVDTECIIPVEGTQQVVHPRQILGPAATRKYYCIPSSGETWSTLAAALEYPVFGQNTIVSSNQTIRIYAAASVDYVSPDEKVQCRATHLKCDLVTLTPQLPKNNTIFAIPGRFFIIDETLRIS